MRTPLAHVCSTASQSRRGEARPPALRCPSLSDPYRRLLVRSLSSWRPMSMTFRDRRVVSALARCGDKKPAAVPVMLCAPSPRSPLLGIFDCEEQHLRRPGDGALEGDMFGSKALPTERLRELFHGDQLAHHRARGRVGWRHGEESLSPHAVALSVGENATAMGLDGIPKARFDLVGPLLRVSPKRR